MKQEIDWTAPLEVVGWVSGIQAKIWIWENDCKWLEVGNGRYMYNNDGTCVSGGGPRVRNCADYRARVHVEGRDYVNAT